MEEEEKKVEPKEKLKFEVIVVPTETGLAIKDNDSGETLDSLTLLVKVANTLEQLKKGITG